VFDGGGEVYSFGLPFRHAVPRGSLLLSSGRVEDLSKGGEQPLETALDVDAPALTDADQPPVFVHEVKHIRAEVLRTQIANPPGFRVRIYVDQAHLVEIYKDVNPVPNPDGSPKAPYDLETAIARARSWSRNCKAGKKRDHPREPYAWRVPEVTRWIVATAARCSGRDTLESKS
jgi:hypothetical protein